MGFTDGIIESNMEGAGGDAASDAELCADGAMGGGMGDKSPYDGGAAGIFIVVVPSIPTSIPCSS